MKPLLLGMSDSLNILAFKWRSIRSTNQRVFLSIVLGLLSLLIIGAAYTGVGLRFVMTTPSAASNSADMQSNFILWINLFLANNASTAAGGVIWALIMSILIIPLVGYSFSSLIPEGDLASIKVTDNHKISDSILLQFVSTISFIQLLVITALSSILTISSQQPGIGIVFSWIVWAVSVLATVLAAWGFEFVYRKFGVKIKVAIFALIITIVGGIYLLFPENFLSMYGLGDKYVAYIQQLTLDNPASLLTGLGILAVTAIALLFAISQVASITLQRTERVKNQNNNIVFLAKLGLQNKNNISTITQFLTLMVLRQNNIWKPLLLSVFFTAAIAAAFHSFYDIFSGLATLIPVMVSLVWSVNVFGIIGSGTTWLVSLPYGKEKLLKSVTYIQYGMIFIIGSIVALTVTLLYNVSFYDLARFALTIVIAGVILTQFSIKKAVYNPYRYRVHIRGESVIPPDKAFTYMFQLFFIGFLITGLVYLIGGYVTNVTGNPYIGLLSLLAIALVTLLVNGYMFNSLKNDWLRRPEITQNIIKAVGQH